MCLRAMNVFRQIELFNRINELIQKEETGNPCEFSKRLKISRCHMYRHLELLKDYGAPIKYSRKKKSFFYAQPFRCFIKLELTLIPKLSK